MVAEQFVADNLHNPAEVEVGAGMAVADMVVVVVDIDYSFARKKTPLSNTLNSSKST